jgi:hypothetical protein
VIPRTILQTSRQKPETYIKEQLSRFLDGTWRYVHFTDEEMVSFFVDNRLQEFPLIVEKFHAMPTGAHKADLFRYYYLFINGGVFIDYDAMIKKDIGQVCSDFDFFTVRSAALRNSLFQGFMGATPNNSIIHEALRDIYRVDPEQLRRDYLLLCKSLDRIVKERSSGLKIKLFHELAFANGVAETIDDDGTIVLLHYWGQRVVSKLIGSTITGLSILG